MKPKPLSDGQRRLAKRAELQKKKGAEKANRFKYKALLAKEALSIRKGGGPSSPKGKNKRSSSIIEGTIHKQRTADISHDTHPTPHTPNHDTTNPASTPKRL